MEMRLEKFFEDAVILPGMPSDVVVMVGDNTLLARFGDPSEFKLFERQLSIEEILVEARKISRETAD